MANFGNEVLYLFVNFLATPALMMGLFAMVGSLIQRKTWTDVFISGIKTIMGYLILGAGAALLSTSLNGFDATFQALFGVSPVIPNNDGIGGLAQNALGIWGTLASFVMVFGMLGNLMLAKLTKLKYIYLSGHVLFYISICIVVTGGMLGMNMESPSFQDMALMVTAGALIVSLYMVISPAICQKYMRDITKTDDVAMGHTSSLNYFIAGAIGSGISKIKKNIKKCDELNIPGKLGFLRNRSIMITLTMLIIYMIVFITGWSVLGKQWFVDNGIFENDSSIIVEMLIKSFQFAAGMEVVLMGVRGVINELIPSFKGISDKAIKGAKPALDCPVVFPYSQNGMFIGFFGSIIGGLVMFGISILLTGLNVASYVIIPGTISIFFTGATAGVFGDAKGGVAGAFIGGIVNGFLVTLIPYIFILLNLLPTAILEISATWGDADFVIGLFIGIWKAFNINVEISKWIVFASSILVWFSVLIIFFDKNAFKKNIKNENESIVEQKDDTSKQ